jgi:hypothetical protein
MRKLILVVFTAASLWGQGFPGKSTARRITPASPEQMEIARAAPIGGDFHVTFNISVKSALPAGATVWCTLEAAVEDGTTTLLGVYNEWATVEATGTGAARTCVLDLHYSWPLVTPSNDQVGFQYAVQVSPPAISGLIPIEGPSTGASYLSGAVPVRSSVGTRAGPIATGGTTAVSIAVTL